MEEREKFAVKKLEECKTKPVLFTVKTSISYKGNIDDDAPISGKVKFYFSGLTLTKSSTESYCLGSEF